MQGLETFWKVAAMMGVPFFVGLFWRRATSTGAWASTGASFAALLFTSQIGVSDKVLWDFNAVFADKLPDFMLLGDKLYLAWQMIIYLVLGLVTHVGISLLTKPEGEEKLDKFYQCIRTPVRHGEPETAPFTLPDGVAPAPRNVLIKHRDFEIPKPTVTGLLGFLAGWAGVGALIAAFFWILRR